MAQFTYHGDPGRTYVERALVVEPGDVVDWDEAPDERWIPGVVAVEDLPNWKPPAPAPEQTPVEQDTPPEQPPTTPESSDPTPADSANTPAV